MWYVEPIWCTVQITLSLIFAEKKMIGKCLQYLILPLNCHPALKSIMKRPQNCSSLILRPFTTCGQSDFKFYILICVCFSYWSCLYFLAIFHDEALVSAIGNWNKTTQHLEWEIIGKQLITHYSSWKNEFNPAAHILRMLQPGLCGGEVIQWWSVWSYQQNQTDV